MTDLLSELLNEKVGSDMIRDFAGRLRDLEWKSEKKTMVGFVVRQGKSELCVLLSGHQTPALTCCPSALLSSRYRLHY